MTWLIVLLVALALLALGAWGFMRAGTAGLRRRFGPEYDRALEAHGGARRPAEASLRDRARRRDALDVRPLAAPVRARYLEGWRQVQLRFVDEPAAAVRQADMLVVEVLRERGYAPAGGDGRDGGDEGDDGDDDGLALASVDHPELVAGYRAARRPGDGVDACRDAFLQMRALFDRLVEPVAPDDEPGAGDAPAVDPVAEGSAEPAAYGSVVGERRVPPG